MNLKREGDTAVAVFGLTGDPFTVAHRAICKQAMDKLPIDKLYVIPTIVSYHRKDKKPWLNDYERLQCARDMLWSLGPDYLTKWQIECQEVDLKFLCEFTERDMPYGLCDDIIAKRRFIHTLLDFRCRIGMFKQTMLILGTDSVKNLPTWYRWKEVCHNISSIVVVNGRDGEDIEVPSEVREIKGRICNLPLEDDELLKVSASKVRAACQKNGDNVNTYFEIVKDYDQGKISLEELGWI